MALGREGESTEELLDRMDTDPRSVRREWKVDLLEERGQEWWDENEKYLDRWFDNLLALDGFATIQPE